MPALIPSRIAIVGGGLSGLTAAWALRDSGHLVTLLEASPRSGGIVETVRRDGFVIETGPDGWITEKPAAAVLALELGLTGELIASNDVTRVTYILVDGRLQAMPPGMRMMVPTDLDALNQSPLFTAAARRAYAEEITRAEELKAGAPHRDESIAAFVLRHFGPEVLHKIAAPLLSGVFGGDVETLSVRAVMPAFVQMERVHGSLILALRQAQRTTIARPIFTTLRNGTQTLVDHLAARLPTDVLRLNAPVLALTREADAWIVTTPDGPATYDRVILATPPHVTTRLLTPLLPTLPDLLPHESSSAIIVALAFTESFPLPPGFGFLVPAGEQTPLFAATFTDQKYPHRAPPNGRLLRAFFGGTHAESLAPQSDEQLAALAHRELSKILGPLPAAAFHVVRRWPHSLPQYAVGHLERIAELRERLAPHPTLHLIGNAYQGVGLPDLIAQARTLAAQLET